MATLRRSALEEEPVRRLACGMTDPGSPARDAMEETERIDHSWLRMYVRQFEWNRPISCLRVARGGDAS